MSDETKVIELRPEQRVLREAELEARRCQHKYLFQQMAVEACVALAVKGEAEDLGKVLVILADCDKMAEIVLRMTEGIWKR